MPTVGLRPLCEQYEYPGSPPPDAPQCNGNAPRTSPFIPQQVLPNDGSETLTMSEIPAPHPVRCIHLTCKSMMVYGEDFENDPEFQAGMVEFTCTETFRNLGPDGGEVSFDACRNQERKCFREF